MPIIPTAIYPSLRDKNVLITGGAEGIGAAAVELFCRQSSNVWFFDIAVSSAEKLVEHITKLKPAHEDFPISVPKFLQCDVTDLEQARVCYDQVACEAGDMDVLVNNAATPGARSRVSSEEVTPESWEADMNVNLRHVFFLTQLVVPGMRERSGGCIINMGSIIWRIPAAGLPVYAAAKAAIMGLTKTHSKEFGPDIRVNSVVPGAISTERQDREIYARNPAYRNEVLQQQALKRHLEPMEVASVILFLASDDSSGVTGSNYVVDGGWVGDV